MKVLLWLALVQCPDGTPPPCGAPARSGPPVVIVTPFENRSADSADAYLAASLTDDLAAVLQQSAALRVLNPRASRRGADWVLAGSLRRDRGNVRASVRLERPGSGEIAWATTLVQPLARMMDVPDSLAARILTQLRIDTRGAPARRATDPVAWDLYLRGRYFTARRNEADFARGMPLLRQAVARDSAFALAWAEIVHTLRYAAIWGIPVPGSPPESVIAHQLAASHIALLADSANPEIWVARAMALNMLDRTSHAEPLRALRRALALDSLNAGAWAAFGTLLAESGDEAGGRRALRRAIALDPGRIVAMNDLVMFYYWANALDSAAVWADSIVATDPLHISGRRVAGTVALARGRIDEAESQFAAARTIGPGAERIWSLAGLAAVAAARGDSAAARSLASELEAMVAAGPVHLHSAVFMASALVATGRAEAALQWLERYRPAGDLHFQQHLRDRALDPLRTDPRFQRLLRPRS